MKGKSRNSLSVFQSCLVRRYNCYPIYCQKIKKIKSVLYKPHSLCSFPRDSSLSNEKRKLYLQTNWQQQTLYYPSLTPTWTVIQQEILQHLMLFSWIYTCCISKRFEYWYELSNCQCPNPENRRKTIFKIIVCRNRAVFLQTQTLPSVRPGAPQAPLCLELPGWWLVA